MILLIVKTDDPTLLNSTKDLLGVITISPRSSIENKILLNKYIIIER